MKKYINSLFLIMLFIVLSCPSLIYGKENHQINFFESGGNYYCYPWMNVAPPSQTSPPEGYIPFHIEHYGRHGSRWHIGSYNYDKPYEILKKGYEAGKLTPLGIEVFQMVDSVRTEFLKGRDGELSDKGSVQHKQIGKRMVNNFPEIFDSTTIINARSTVIIRSILSMFNGISGIQSLVPYITVYTDASQADMNFLNYDDETASKKKEAAYKSAFNNFSEKHSNNGNYLNKLFNDTEYACDSVDPQLFNPLFSFLVNAQSHEGQPWLTDKVFTPEEALERWKIRNANWFIQSGNSKLTDNRVPFTQANLLYNIIESADSAIVSNKKSVNLRYGHDSVVFPLTVLMEIDDYGQEINDLEDLETLGWHDYRVIPMGANIQIIFYRNDLSANTDDILVKVMLNEIERRLPVEPFDGPYYRWADLRDYYLNKLNNFRESENNSLSH